MTKTKAFQGGRKSRALYSRLTKGQSDIKKLNVPDHEKREESFKPVLPEKEIHLETKSLGKLPTASSY